MSFRISLTVSESLGDTISDKIFKKKQNIIFLPAQTVKSQKVLGISAADISAVQDPQLR